jgi:hypothetical protein
LDEAEVLLVEEPDVFLGRLTTEEMLSAAAAQERPRSRVFPSHVRWTTIEVNYLLVH